MRSIFLFSVCLGNRYQGPGLALHLLQWQGLPELLQMVLGLLVSLDLALLLPLFTGPEEAGDVLGGGLHHGVRL